MILKEVDKRNSCASVIVKYSILKQTFSNWLKNKKQIYEAVDSNLSKEETPIFRALANENLDEAYYT